MEKEDNNDNDNDGSDLSADYFRKKKSDNDYNTYFPPEVSEYPYY